MLDTFQALGVALLAILPGAGYTFAFERVVGSFGVTFADRLSRFLVASAVFHSVASAAEYSLYVHSLRSGAFIAGHSNPWLLELLAVLYVVAPIAFGSFVGHGWQRKWRWVQVLTGPAPAPRAWDYLFSSSPQGYLRLKLRSGVWIGGFYGPNQNDRQSYAAGFPNDQDLFIARSVAVDPRTGVFLLDAQNDPQVSDAGLLVRWSEVELLEFTEVTDEQS